MSEVAVHKDQLTASERSLAEAGFAFGPSAFVKAGMSVEEYLAFISRPAVVSLYKMLSDEFKDATAMNRRRQFMAKRALAHSIPSAIRVIERAIKGPQYRKVNGKAMTDSAGRFMIARPGPTSSQVAAAQDLLNRLNISSADRRDQSGFASLAIKMNYGLDREEGVKIEYDPGATSTEMKHSRTKLRRMMQLLEPNLMKLLPKLNAVTDKVVKDETSDRVKTVVSRVVKKKRKKNRRHD